MSNGTVTAITMPMYHEDRLSASGLSASPRHQTSQIAKTYRQAAQLFLTRRLPEALSTIEPVITPPAVDDDAATVTPSTADLTPSNKSLAPIAAASRGTRVKVWSFYLTFLNAVIELGPEEGKHAFGSTKWKALVNKARDGSVWEDIVRDGYYGQEGNVDADVVINLATLLLTHSPSQKLNQTRLENYLAAVANPSFDITSHLSNPRLRRTASTPGTNTPRDLQTNLKLLELYTLHVLPRNQEWDYAREFIMMSELLDDERKEAFLQALHGLKEEQAHAALREKELQRQQDAQLEAQRRRAEEERRAAARAAEDEARRREEARRAAQRPPDAEPARTSPAKSSRKKEVARRPPASMYTRATALWSGLADALFGAARGVRANPLAMLRTLLVLLAFALAFGRRDVRERVRRIIRRGWEKVRGTVGMGVKVSYI
ncbi:hypothetical protein EJ06DRAFT_581860 [Trichodelitschia bisporula]|uniref:Peroxin 26 n=1 Tax=Trichodelitschia bisporula TaxID=703511 RepID=A0A6G1HXM8_9PEZI|nr:hypothetical protein EJ06DRAFT_581860 [Trichodelitschia bisporula]